MKRIILGLLLALPLAAQSAITHRFTGAAANDLADGVVEPSIGSAEGLTLGGTTNSGDLVVCAVAQRAATDYTTISASGYTVLFGEDRAAGPTVAILGKIAGASEAVPTITSTDKTNANTLIAQCAVFAGAQATLDGIVAHQAFDNDGASQTSIDTPALAISTDNTVAIMIAAKNNDFNAENPALPFISGCTAAECELGEAQRTSSAQIGMVWGFEIQTTATNIASGSVALTENTTYGTTVAVSLKSAAAAPTWSVEPTVSVQDDNDYTLSYTPSTSATFYAVACKKDQTAPSIAQVKAGNCTGDVAAVASVNEAVTGADTTVLGGSLTYPIHDLYAVLSNGGGDSTLVTLADEMLDAPTGYQYDLLTSISATSPCQELNDIPISPTIAATDVTKWTTATSPSGYAFTAGVDCETQYTDPSGSRQTATLDVYDTSAGDWMSGGPTTIYFNNTVPECLLSGCQYDTEQALINGAAMTAVDMATWFLDSDVGDTLAITTSSTGTGTGADKIPAGTSIDGDGNWTGTPACASGDTTGSFTTTATDDAGDTEAVEVTWTCYDQVVVPACVGTTLSACGEAAALVNLDLGATLVHDAGTAVGYVVSQGTAAGTEVDPFTTLDITVSLGRSAAGRRRTLGLGVGVGRFMPEIDFDTVRAVGGQ